MLVSGGREGGIHAVKSKRPVRCTRADEAEAGPTFPPPGWCFMLSVEPILERTLRMSGAGAVPGRAVALEVVVVVVEEEVVRAARGTAGFFSGTVPVVEEGVAGLAAVVRVRDAAVVEAELRLVVVVVLGFVESAGGRVIQSFIAKLDIHIHTLLSAENN